MKKLALLLLVLDVLCGCTAKSGVVSLSPDTFLAYRQQAFMGLSETDTLILELQAKVFQDANEYCLRQNKKILILDTSETYGPYPLFGEKPRAEIRFRCLYKTEVSNLDPGCIKECLAAYSSCITAGDNGEDKTAKLRACKEAYNLCISTCPPE